MSEGVGRVAAGGDRIYNGATLGFRMFGLDEYAPKGRDTEPAPWRPAVEPGGYRRPTR